MVQEVISINRETYDHHNPENLKFKSVIGINEPVVRAISADKNEPEWMLKKRLEGFKVFLEKPVPTWGPDLSELNLDEIHYYMKPEAVKNSKSWDDVPADIRQTYEKLGIPQAERTVLAGVGAQYECLSGDSQVFTNPKGPVKIKNIKEGDYVFAFDEENNEIKKSKVLAVLEKGYNEVFEVVADNKKIKTTENHPFLTLSYYKEKGMIRGRYKREWKSLRYLKQGDLIAIAKTFNYDGENYILDIPKIKEFGKGKNQFGIEYKLPLNYKYNKIILPKESSEDLMWLLGVYIGDGFIKKSKNTDKKSIEIAIPESQSKLRDELKNVTKKLFDYDITSWDKDRIRIYSTTIANFFDINGFGGNAHEKRVPKWITKLPIEQRLAFLAGYTDSDGYPTDERKSNVLIFRSVNRDLINDLRDLSIYCYFHPSNIHLIKSKHPFDKDRIMISYQIEISGDLKKIKSRYPPKATRLNAKNNFKTYGTAKGTDFRKHINENIGFVKIKSIKKVGMEKVYDITVDGFHNFIAEGIIVHNSEVVYHNLKKELSDKGVVFLDMDEALIKYPEMVKKYFMTTCVPIRLHKYAALHAAVWSGGTFIYVPKNVKVKEPLQAYFRMNAKKGGQFEHTLIIADEGSEIHYIEGCSAPQYTSNSLHAGCVEIHVLKDARVRYSSIENWSKNTYNLNTKRAVVKENGIIEWVNGNMGCLTGDSKVFTNPKGPKNIESIEAGDKVYVFDEKENKIKKSIVRAKIFSGEKKVYKLEAAGREIEASANHPFLTLIRKKSDPSHKKGFFYKVWKPLEDLKVGDLLAIPKKLPLEGNSYILPKIEINNFVDSNNQYSEFKMNSSYLYNKNIVIPEKTNEDFMWLCGILIGDGHIDTKQNKINIATHVTEDYRDHLVQVLKKLFNYTVTEKKERYIIINSKVLCQLFSEIGISGNADTKKVPNWVFALPENEILSFLAGYFDSDGHPGKGGLYFTSINKPLLESIKYLGISIGFGVSRIFNHGKAREMHILGKKTTVKDSFRILLNGSRIKDLPIRCERKKERIDKTNPKRNFVSAKGLNFKSKVNDEIGFATINKIEYTGIKPTFDIEVDDYHNFISNGLIVHNSKVTMLYPCSMLTEENAKSDYIGIAFAGKGQYQDTGCKVYHLAPHTSSNVISKSISQGGGITSYRGLVQIRSGAVKSKSSVVCDGLMLDNDSKAMTFPSMEVNEDDVKVAHEAAIGRVGEEQLFYLMSRGLSEEEATKMIVSGFIEPLIRELPLEYAVELNRLIELEIENSVC